MWICLWVACSSVLRYFRCLLYLLGLCFWQSSRAVRRVGFIDSELRVWE